MRSRGLQLYATELCAFGRATCTVGWEEAHGELCIHFIIPAGGTDYYHTDSSKTGSKRMTVGEEIYLGCMFLFSFSFQGFSVHMVYLDDVHILFCHVSFLSVALPTC